jgi:hypothetical protein
MLGQEVRQDLKKKLGTASIEPMQPIELYKAHVDKDQRRLSSSLQRSIRTQVRSNESTRPKAQYAPLRSNYNGHFTENNIYVPENTGHQRKTHFDDQL